MPKEKIVCLSHDIERGWGHSDVDPEFAASAHRTAPQYLEAMLRVEQELNIRAMSWLAFLMKYEMPLNVEATALLSIPSTMICKQDNWIVVGW